MTELLTAAQMRAIEQAAIASGEVTGLELMERAGRGGVEAILDEWPAFREGSRRAVVLCGPGNNGGDGFVVARLLKESGWAVEVFLYGDAAKLPPDARVNYERWLAMGAVEPIPFIHRIAPPAGPEALVVDALFGTGLSRALPVEVIQGCLMTFDLVTVWPWHRIAIDIPSGLCSDSGRRLRISDGRGGATFQADLTVTFHRPKVAHFVNEGPGDTGKLVVKDIGLDQTAKQPPTDLAATLEGLQGKSLPEIVAQFQADRNAALKTASQRIWLTDFLPELAKGPDHASNKFSNGHALILSGPATRTGASRLAARGALRIGAGLVTVACPPDAAPEHAARLDAIMLRTVPDAAALTDLLTDHRITTVCIGPGLGLDAHASALVEAVLRVSDPRDPGLGPGWDKLEGAAPNPAAAPPPPSPPHEGEGGRLPPAAERNPVGIVPDHDPKEAPPPATSASPPPCGEGLGVGGVASATPATPNQTRHTILDADALTLLARNPPLFAQLHENCVLTPHAGEFARLFPDIAARLTATPTTGPAYSKVDATRDAAARAGCTILFKGPDTVIADPSGRCSINSAHYDRAAPWLATAGSGDVLAGFIAGLLARGFSPFDAACTAAWLHVECALSFGPGLIAEDLPEELPKVFRALKV